MEGIYLATVDRIVDGVTAVLLIEEDGGAIDEMTVPAEDLPAPARDGGGVLLVTVEDGTIVKLENEAEQTEKRRESIEEQLDRLSRRLDEE